MDRPAERAQGRRVEPPPAAAALAREPGDVPTVAQVRALQRAAGNRAVAALLRAPGPPPQARTLARSGFSDLASAPSEYMAPLEIEIPTELAAGMETAWKGSLPKGESQEQGGVLVKKKDGSYEWRAGKAGTSGTFSPNYGAVKKGESLVAVGHTHPYSAKEKGHTDVAFSDQDLARLVTVEDPVSIVRSGAGEFVVAKTKEFNDLVKGLTATEKTTMKADMKKLWNERFKAATGTFQQRVELAVKAVCLQYHLVYYTGTGGKLKQPDDLVGARLLTGLLKVLPVPVGP